jgi:hypothetical protein
MTERRLIADIVIGTRHRKDLGDLNELANNIAEIGLMYPIVATPGGVLVDGERRLRACEKLGWTEIEARVVDLEAIVRGEFSANHFRKQWTPSERVAIFESIKRLTRGRPTNNRAARPDIPNPLADQYKAAEIAGFGSASTAKRARIVTNRGIPALVEAMDQGELDITAGALLARMSQRKQKELMSMTAHDRNGWLRVYAAKERAAKRANARVRTITIPWRAKPASRLLVRTWPRYRVEELIEELQRRLAAGEGPKRPDPIDIAVERDGSRRGTSSSVH